MFKMLIFQRYHWIIICLFLFSTLSNANNDDVTYNWKGRTYKLIHHAKSWSDARELCENNGTKLAVPKTEEEFLYLQSIVRAMHYPSVVGTKYKLLVWTGISNLDDYKTWKDINGENFVDNDFHTWTGGNDYSDRDSLDEPRCAGIDAANYGMRKHWCHLPQPYICFTST